MRVRLGIVSDLHWASSDETGSWHNPFDIGGVLDRLRQANSVLREHECDVLVCLGDLTHHPGDSSRDLIELWRTDWTGPLVIVPGNHDTPEVGCTVAEHTTRRSSSETQLQRVLLRHDPKPEGRFESHAREASARVRLVASHYPLVDRRKLLERNGFAYAGNLANRQALAEELAGSGVPSVVLCGHLHVRDTVVSGPILQLAIAALVEPPFECALVEVEARADDTVAVERTSIALAPSRPGQRLPLFVPAYERWLNTAGRWSSDQLESRWNRTEHVSDRGALPCAS